MSINPGGRAITTLSCRLRRFFPLPFPVMAIFLSPPLFLPFLLSFHPSPAPDSSQQGKWVKKGKKRRQSFLIKFTGNEVILDRDRVSRGVCEFHNRLNGFPLGLFLLRAPDEKQSEGVFLSSARNKATNETLLRSFDERKRKGGSLTGIKRLVIDCLLKSNPTTVPLSELGCVWTTRWKDARVGFWRTQWRKIGKGEREREGRGRQDGSLSRESLCTLRYARVAPMWRHFRRPQPPSEPVYHRSSLFLPSASPFSLSLSPFLPLYYLTCSSRCLSLSLFLFVSTIRWFVDRKGTEECMRALARENLDATRLSSRGRCFSAWGIRFTKKRIPVVLSLSLSHVSSPYPLHYEHVSAELSFPGTCSGGWTRWKDQRFIPIRVPLSKSESRHVTEAGSSIFLFSVPLPLSPPLYRLPSRKNFFSSALNGRLRVLENIRITGVDT